MAGTYSDDSQRGSLIFRGTAGELWGWVLWVIAVKEPWSPPLMVMPSVQGGEYKKCTHVLEYRTGAQGGERSVGWNSHRWTWGALEQKMVKSFPQCIAQGLLLVLSAWSCMLKFPPGCVLPGKSCFNKTFLRGLVMARNLKAELSHLAILYTDIIRKAGILALELYNRRCSAWQVKSIPPPPLFLSCLSRRVTVLLFNEFWGVR